MNVSRTLTHGAITAAAVAALAFAIEPVNAEEPVPSYQLARGDYEGGGGAGETGGAVEEEGVIVPEEPGMEGGGGAGETGTGAVGASEVMGTVRTVAPEQNEITVQTEDGMTQTYTTGTDTEVWKDQQQAQLSDVQQGDSVQVTLAEDGTTVKSITVNPQGQ